MNLQQQVQQYLQNTGISLRELSRRSGVSHTTIGKILRGGEYKSGTANDLIFAMSFYGGDTARPVMQDKAAETLDATVEQLAAQCVNADLTHHADWDVDLQCAKYRRVMALEKELEQTKVEVQVWREKTEQARRNAYALQNQLSDSADVLAQREQHLKSCENALIEAHEKRDELEKNLHAIAASFKQACDERDTVRRNYAALEQDRGHIANQLKSAQGNAESSNKYAQDLAKALADSKKEYDLMAASWKAACVQVEQLQKQLADKRENYQELYEYSIQQAKDEKEMLAQIDTLFAERDNMRTEYEYSLMCLRVRCFALVCAIVFLIVSGLVLWGAV